MKIPKYVIVSLTEMFDIERVAESFTAINSHLFTFRYSPEALENTLMMFRA